MGQSRELALSKPVSLKRPEPKAYLDGSVHLLKSSLRETAHPASKTALVNGIEMAKMDNRSPRQSGFLWSNLDSHWKSSHSEITRDSRHNRQPTRLVPHIILDNECRMRPGHLTSSSRREIDETNFASS